MKLKCDQGLLMEYINLVQKSVANKTTMPILECLLLKCDDDGFRITSTDLEIGIKTVCIESKVIEKGAIALPAKFFSDIIRRLPADEVTIEVKSGLVVVIKCRQSEFKIVGKHAEEFPELPVVEREKEYILTQKLFKELIRHTSFSICTDDSKPNLMGALLEVRGDNVRMVTCDSVRVSYMGIQHANLQTEYEKVIIPAKAINEIYKLLSEDETEFSFYITKKHILFDISKCIVVSRLIDGEFFNYENIFPEEFDTTVTALKSDVVAALERAMLISFQDNKKIPVRLTINDSTLVVITGAETGNSYDEVDINFAGKELEISFNPKFLLDAVQSINEEKLIIEFNTQLSPCVIRPFESSDYKYLVLPLRLR